MAQRPLEDDVDDAVVPVQQWLLLMCHERAGRYDNTWVRGIARAVDGRYAVVDWMPRSWLEVEHFRSGGAFLPVGDKGGWWSDGYGHVQWCDSYAAAADTLRDWCQKSPSDDEERDQRVLQAIPPQEPAETVKVVID